MAAQCAWNREHLPELLVAREAHESTSGDQAGARAKYEPCTASSIAVSPGRSG
jgi:hypothetical protein